MTGLTQLNRTSGNICACIYWYKKHRRRPPLLREIACECYVAQPVVAMHLKLLRELGHVDWQDNKKCTLYLKKPYLTYE